MINIAEILKDCPRGTKLYSPICGECTFEKINLNTSIIVCTQDYRTIAFNVYGQYFKDFDNAECLLFPSKENRDWNTFQKSFKVGDKVKHIHTGIYCHIKAYADELKGYYTSIGHFIKDNNVDEWEIIPNKFDISTLKPFDKVLVRHLNDNVWVATFFSHYEKDLKFGCYPFVTTSLKSFPKCIPYKGNEYLLGTTHDCEEFYKTWCI